MGYTLFIGGCLLAYFVMRALAPATRRATAAVVVQTALEAHMPWATPSSSPQFFANRLLGDLSHQWPVVIQEEEGQTLNKYAIAAVALARGLESVRSGSEDETAIFLALGAVLMAPVDRILNKREIGAMDYAQRIYMRKDTEKRWERHGLTPEREAEIRAARSEAAGGTAQP